MAAAAATECGGGLYSAAESASFATLLTLLLLSTLSGALLTLVLLWAQLLPFSFTPLTHSSAPSLTSLCNPPAISRPIFSNALHPPIPRLRFTNFTVDSLLPPSRWPSLINPNQPRILPPSDLPPNPDPFTTGSPHRFHGVRGAVISLFTPHQSELVSYFPDNDRYFFSTMADHTDLIFFYTVYPLDSDSELHSELTDKLHCSELTDRGSLGSRNASNSDIYARLRHPAMAFPQRLQGVREFLSPHGTHILTVPIAVNLPRYIVADPAHLLRDDWPEVP